MTLNSLLPGRSADVPDVLIHMTGRTGKRSDAVSKDILAMSALERLASILSSQTIIAAPAFDYHWPLVCFNQSTKRALSRLVPAHYEPVGIAFHKQAVFVDGGGPAHYVRGDDYDDYRQALPDRMAARAVRYWPGSSLVYDGRIVNSSRSEWMHEREWRIPAPESEPWCWRFDRVDVAFVLLGDSYVNSYMGWAQSTWNSWASSLDIAVWNSTKREFDYGGIGWV